jgi:hypothetical protein
MLENASRQFHIQTFTFSNTESTNLDLLTTYLNLFRHEIRQVKFSKIAKDVCFFLLVATLTILVSGFADCFAQDSSTGARNLSSSRRSHLSQPAKTAAQRSSSTSSPTRDAQAVSLAVSLDKEALHTPASGVAITGATVQGTSDFIACSDQESGDATLEGHPGYESKLMFAWNAGWRSDVRNRSAAPQHKWTGADTAWHSVPAHSCWTGATRLFPVLTIQPALSDPQISLIHLGQGTKGGIAVPQIQISRVVPRLTTTPPLLTQDSSQVDIDPDSTANLPLAADFNALKLAASSLPSAPEPKIRPEGEPATLRLAALPFLPVKPATRPRETPKQRKIWYLLVVASHSAATFDAWTTRRALASGADHETNPSLRPFANSNAIYAAMQACPAFLDFLGKRMMVSKRPWIRKFWWIPQVAGASLSFRSGVDNMKLNDETH